MVTELEKVSLNLLKEFYNTYQFYHLKDEYGIPAAFCGANNNLCRSVGTAIACGYNYWSPVHTDDDYMYTSLSCLSPKKHDKDILFYFVFPDYNVACPMRSGDIMIFNPHVAHSTTNPTKEGIDIFSLYVPAKTCNAQIALHYF